ncbi:hypothetical protein [Actinomyces sp. oral taxon 175]|nr:hypothetical protein [Actinomyces sp. oral taxon 175]
MSEFHDVGTTRSGFDQLLITISDREASAVAKFDRLGLGFCAFAEVR